MLLTKEQQQTLDRLLMEDGNTELLPELIYEAPEFLNQIDEKLVDVDEYYHTKDFIYECDDGRYFCLTVTQHSSMVTMKVHTSMRYSQKKLRLLFISQRKTYER